MRVSILIYEGVEPIDLATFGVLSMVRHARLVDTGTVLTGGGVSLCVDLTLYLLERYLGPEVARETARISIYPAAFDANAARLPALLEPAQGR